MGEKNAHVNFLLIRSGSMQPLTYKIKKLTSQLLIYLNFEICIMKKKLKN